MKISFNRPYKSIRQFADLELPDFVVLTGVNGAGKSHLLEGLENGSLSIEGVPPNQLHGEKPTRRFDGTSLVTQDTGAFSGAQISSELAGYWENIRQHWQGQSESFFASLRSLQIPDLEKMEPRDIVSLKTEHLVKMGFTPESASSAVLQIYNVSQAVENQVIAQFSQQDPNIRNNLIKKFNTVKKLPIFAMSQDDFYESYPDNWQQIDLFQQSFSRLFSAYQRNWRANQLRGIGQAKGENIVALTEFEFVKKYGTPPWDYLNEVLEVANLDFRINKPFQWDDRPYEPMLTDEKRDIQVKFADLSSGERVIMSFALCLYHVNDPRAAIEYPKVLLFDEIDAPLHPSMTSSLLRTIEKTLVNDRQIKVILTTHSPSTVALSPPGSIFAMKKTGLNRVQKCSKDAALGILTTGVPTLSVNFENRRQIFVESKYDAVFYSLLYELSRESLVPDISMSFIASGSGGNGNCDQVISVVKQLRAAGSKTVFGLIDWDLKNKSGDGSFVLGSDDRYSIENYILDPLLIGLLVLREKIVDPKEFGLPEGSTYLSVSPVDVDSLAKIAKKVSLDLDKYADSDQKLDSAPSDFIYRNSVSISLPRWLKLVQGHKLELTIKQAYPQLNKYKNEPDLKAAIISLVLDERPGLIPNALISTLKDIQSFSYSTDIQSLA